MASLTREADCCRLYHEQLEGPAQAAQRAAVFGNLAYAVSNSIPFCVIGLVFYVGSTFLLSGIVSTHDFFVAFTAVVLGSLRAGHSTLPTAFDFSDTDTR